MVVGDANVFPGFLTPLLTQLFFPKPPTTFLTCFCRGERRKYTGKKSRLNQGSNSQPPGYESYMRTTEPAGRGYTFSIWVSRTKHLQIKSKVKISLITQKCKILYMEDTSNVKKKTIIPECTNLRNNSFGCFAR